MDSWTDHVTKPPKLVDSLNLLHLALLASPRFDRCGRGVSFGFVSATGPSGCIDPQTPLSPHFVTHSSTTNRACLSWTHLRIWITETVLQVLRAVSGATVVTKVARCVIGSKAAPHPVKMGRPLSLVGLKTQDLTAQSISQPISHRRIVY